jgi:hypothetical protein
LVDLKIDKFILISYNCVDKVLKSEFTLILKLGPNLEVKQHNPLLLNYIVCYKLMSIVFFCRITTQTHIL